MKMFFSNGGTDCYIVSIGGYIKTAKDGKESPNTVEMAVLQTGIEPLLKEMEPTMLLIPELITIRLTRDKNGDVADDDVKALYSLRDEPGEIPG